MIVNPSYYDKSLLQKLGVPPPFPYGDHRLPFSIQHKMGLAGGGCNPYILGASAESVTPEWLPTSIGGCLAWYREDAIYDEENRESQITDKSGQGNHATQTTDAKKFLYVPDQLDGYPIHRSDGIDDYMSANSLASMFDGDGTPYTIFFVAKANALDGHRTLYCASKVPYQPVPAYFNYHPTGYYEQYRRGDTGSQISATGGTPDTNWHYGVVRFSGTTVTLRIDGLTIIDNVPLIPESNIVTGGLYFTLGTIKFSEVEMYNFGNIDYAEIGAYNSDIGVPNQTLVENYAHMRYPSI